MRMLAAASAASRVLERDRRRVAPDEVAPHEAIEAAGDPGLPRRRVLADELGEVFRGLLERVPNEVSGAVAPARRDAAHDADRRRRWAPADPRTRRGAASCTSTASDAASADARAGFASNPTTAVAIGSSTNRAAGASVPRPAAATLERDFVEDAPQPIEEPRRGGTAPSASRASRSRSSRSRTTATWRTSRPARSWSGRTGRARTGLAIAPARARTPSTSSRSSASDPCSDSRAAFALAGSTTPGLTCARARRARRRSPSSTCASTSSCFWKSSAGDRRREVARGLEALLADRATARASRSLRAPAARPARTCSAARRCPARTASSSVWPSAAPWSGRPVSSSWNTTPSE